TFRRPPTPTLFPYTTLFRSHVGYPHAPQSHGFPFGARPISFRMASTSSACGRWPFLEIGNASAICTPRATASSTTGARDRAGSRSEEHTSELQSLRHLVCRL